jgi:hypothetical protein
MKSYKLEDIEKLADATGLRTCIIDDGVYDSIHVFLGDFCVGVFKKTFKGMHLYELLWTYTEVSEYSITEDIVFTGSVAGSRFFGDLHTLYENMSKKYKELLKTIKAAEIKKCGTEFEI